MTHNIYPSYPIAIANWFLIKNWQDQSAPPCDQIKINKLTFYAAGWYLVYYDTQLFQENIEAWPHGPVIRSLYYEFREFGRRNIDRLGNIVLSNGEKAPHVEKNIDNFLENIWNCYGDKIGIQLSNMTHDKGEPWTIVAENCKYNLDNKPIISADVIKQSFKKKLSEYSSN